MQIPSGWIADSDVCVCVFGCVWVGLCVCVCVCVCGCRRFYNQFAPLDVSIAFRVGLREEAAEVLSL